MWAYPGVRFYQLTDEMKTLSIRELIDFCETIKHTEYLPLSRQWSGSCSRTSPEAAFLGALYFILQKKYPLLGSDDLAEKGKGIWKGWFKFDAIRGLKTIMKRDMGMRYDPNLLIRILAVFQDCSETAAEFSRFLKERKQIDWSVLNETADTSGRIPAQYVIQRDNALGREQFAEEIERFEEKQPWQRVWKEICNYYNTDSSLRDSLEPFLNASASVEQIEAFFSSPESESLCQQCTTLNISNPVEGDAGMTRLPYRLLNYLRMLKELSLYNHEISQIAHLNLPNLIDLNLGKNKLTEFPDVSFSNLLVINVSLNRIKKVCDLNLPNLVRLHAKMNEIEEVSNCNFPKLFACELNGNKLSQIPDCIRKLSSLTHLDLRKNAIADVGELQLPSLIALYLSDNALTSVPDFSELSQLKHLELIKNHLHVRSRF